MPEERTYDSHIRSTRRLAELATCVEKVFDVLADVRTRHRPVPPGGPEAVKLAAARALSTPLVPDNAADPVHTVASLIGEFASWSVDLDHPGAAARMQCPPHPAAVAAELATAWLNQSLHAWESGPFALQLDEWVVAELCRLVGYSTAGGGTLTAGGSLSNAMALLAARERSIATHLGRNTFESGIAGLERRPIVVCSDSTHFSIARGMGMAGLGTDSVLRVPSDGQGRIDVGAVDHVLRNPPAGTLPVAVIACAGSTDLGVVDPLAALADLARKHQIWLHADAAYGGGALFSDRLCGLLRGLAEADSITLDLHKFGWIPASAGVFLVKDGGSLDFLSGERTTLNADDDKSTGFYGRYHTSLQATRRADALKIAVALRVMGRRTLGAMVDRCHDLAQAAARRLAEHPRVELLTAPVLSSVVFRYLPVRLADADQFNAELRRRLMVDGEVLLARTRIPGPDGTPAVFLKLMLLNPDVATTELDSLVDVVLGAAQSLERQLSATARDNGQTAYPGQGTW